VEAAERERERKKERGAGEEREECKGGEGRSLQIAVQY
jgi:hypothetical protein